MNHYEIIPGKKPEPTENKTFNIKIEVDTTEVDKAIEKFKELNLLISKSIKKWWQFWK